MPDKRITLITKYFVPASNVDSNAVYDLILKIRQSGRPVRIDVVTTESDYKTDIKLRDFDQELISSVNLHKVNARQGTPSSNISKFIWGFIEGFKLVRRAKKIPNHTIITLSNPPLIVLWAVLLLHKKRLIYWSFDLFPDAFVADGLIGDKNILYRFMHYLTYNIRQPEWILSLGNNQFHYLKEKFNGNSIQKYVLPCGIHQETKSEIAPDWVDKNKINVAYIGNIGKAHSSEFLKNVISEVHKHEHIHFMLLIYGFHAESIRNYIEENEIENIHFIPPVQRKELAYIDVHLVSLKESWCHLSVPSKAVSAICSGSALWYNGPKESDSWEMFQDSAYYSASDCESIHSVLKQMNKQNVDEKKRNAKRSAGELIETENQTINRMIHDLANSRPNH